jgi:hypothetical protein
MPPMDGAIVRNHISLKALSHVLNFDPCSCLATASIFSFMVSRLYKYVSLENDSFVEQFTLCLFLSTKISIIYHFQMIDI